MEKQWSRVEEIIALTCEQADYYFSLAMNGDIRVKGKFIRDENGRLRPVLVKTTFLPPVSQAVPESKSHSWGAAAASSKKSNWLGQFIKWTRKLIK